MSFSMDSADPVGNGNDTVKRNYDSSPEGSDLDDDDISNQTDPEKHPMLSLRMLKSYQKRISAQATSPLESFYKFAAGGDLENDAGGPLVRSSGRRSLRRERVPRFLRRVTQRITRHRPVTILFFVVLLYLFVAFIFRSARRTPHEPEPVDENPDTDPLPWRAYCSIPSVSRPLDLLPGLQPDNATHKASLTSFPPDDLETLPPTGLFIGVFSIDWRTERRAMIRSTFASHERSRNGAGAGDGGVGTSRSIIRFIIGQPIKDWQRQIEVEQELYNDIVILPVEENMNSGKTYAYFSWAAENAWVPPNYTNITTGTTPPSKAHVSYSSPPPSKLAPHDPELAWNDYYAGKATPWVRPDFIVKMDDDAFLMMAELETRLRVELHRPPKAWNAAAAAQALANPNVDDQSSLNVAKGKGLDPLVYWGYMVSNQFHTFIAGEVYALSWRLVGWIATDPTVKEMTIGAEDKLVSRWMRTLHPQKDDIRWVAERCWIYDHPRAGSVYAHGFLFPSEVDRVRRNITYPPEPEEISDRSMLLTSPAATNKGRLDAVPRTWAHSTTSAFRVWYEPPVEGLTMSQSVEAMVEGSDMSLLTKNGSLSPTTAWARREGRQKRYNNKRVGGTVAVHFAKENTWFHETAMALLYGEETTEWDWVDKSAHSPQRANVNLGSARKVNLAIPAQAGPGAGKQHGGGAGGKAGKQP